MTIKRWMLALLIAISTLKLSAYELFEPYEVISTLQEYGYRLEKTNFPTRYNIYGFAIMIYPSGHLSIENPSLWQSKTGSWHNIFIADPHWQGINFAQGHAPIMSAAPVTEIRIYEQGLTFKMRNFDYYFAYDEGKIHEVASAQGLGKMLKTFEVNSKKKQRQPQYSGPDLPEQVFRLMGLSKDNHFLLYNVEGIILDERYPEHLFIRTNQHVFYQLHLPSAQLEWLSKEQAYALQLRWSALKPNSVWLP